jgi:hypothetical protein
MNRKIISIASSVAVALALTTTSLSADDKLDFTLALNVDPLFGSNPFMGATYHADGGLDYTFYGIQWGDGSGKDWGTWTEFGAGVAFTTMDGALTINPQLGFTMGNLLSSGTEDRGIVGDGIVPNLTINYDTDEYEAELYAGLYLPLRDYTATEDQTTLKYLHYWVNGGKKFNKYFSAGLHFEELTLLGGSNTSNAPYYKWIGPYFQVAKDNVGMRFSAGADLTDRDTSSSQSDFYKLSFFANF